jgi:hypothetical protein
LASSMSHGARTVFQQWQMDLHPLDHLARQVLLA